ncbi:MAG: Calx-beta domain-containing protein, partial [Dolichospermum sp.]
MVDVTGLTYSGLVAGQNYFVKVGPNSTLPDQSFGETTWGSLGAYALRIQADTNSTSPTLAIATTNANQTEGNSGSKAFTFTVTRAVNTTGANNVNWAVTGSGTSPADANDFVGGVLPSGTVSFAAGETSKVITVDVQGDTTVEPNENFTVTLSNPTNGATITTATAIGTIQNDDGNTGNTFTNSAPISIPEGGPSTPNPSTINVSGLSGNISNLKVTLNSLSHTYIGDVDILLVGPTGAKSILMSDIGDVEGLSVNGVTLSFDSGAQTLINGSNVGTNGTYAPNNLVGVWGVEPDVFDLAPSGPYNADLSVFNNTSGNGTWSLYVRDDATPDGGSIAGGWSLTIGTSSTSPTLAIAATNANQTEGNSGSKAFTFTVTRAVNTTGSNNVNWAVTGSGTSAANATDFVGGVLPSGTVSFAAEETSKVITVDVQGDTTVEPNEDFTVTLSNPTNGATITTATAVGTIQNDDVNTDLPIIDLSANQTVVEGIISPQSVTYTVTLSSDSTDTITVQYATVNNTATAGSDYTATNGTLTFAPGVTSQDIIIPILNDFLNEPQETFNLT